MAGPRQKKKLRSSRPKVKPSLNGRTKAGKRKVNFMGNETIAKNWDRKLTLTQNYARLGLSSRLGAPTGGVEKSGILARKVQDGEIEAGQGEKRDPLTVYQSGLSISKPGDEKIVPDEVQVERDPATGRIVRVIRPEERRQRANPLNDPLNEIMDVDESSDEESEDANATTIQKSSDKGIVAQLEAEAAREMENLAKTKKPRHQSQREDEWISKLVEVHGDNTAAMFRDRKLNPMQQSEGDLKRRIKKWKLKNQD